MTCEPAGEPVPAPPGFQFIALPGNAYIGIEQIFREDMGFFKANHVYDKADGEDLMIVATDGGELLDLGDHFVKKKAGGVVPWVFG